MQYKLFFIDHYIYRNQKDHHPFSFLEIDYTFNVLYFILWENKIHMLYSVTRELVTLFCDLHSRSLNFVLLVVRCIVRVYG